MSDIERALRAAGSRAAAEPPDELTRGLVERAAREGLLDVAYAEVDSPVGVLGVAATPRGVVRVAFGGGDDVVEDLAERVSPRVLEAPERLDHIRRELDEYFEGRRTEFAVPIDWSLTRGFFRRVLEETARIRYGRVGTYTQMAAKAGSPRAHRAAGNALASNPICVVVPCHRVVPTSGGIGNYGGGVERKEYLLRLEGALERSG